jgi:Tol biopolymer transport system component
MNAPFNSFFDSILISDEEKTSNASVSKTTSSGLINKRNIIFIDTRVPDYKNLLANIQPDTEVVILDPAKDGIAQITESLLGKQYDSLHIVSHGSAGSLQLGSNYLNSGNLSQYQSQLQQWKTALTEEADILLYGCDVAAGETGISFVQQLSQMTGADVAASNDLTGNAALSGDWDLEVKTGSIEVGLAFSQGVLDTYQYVLPASFTGTYSQNFNTLTSSGNWTDDVTIQGWYSIIKPYAVGTGSSSTGGLYSFGSTSSIDRSLGSLASGTTGTIYYGLRLKNDTSSPISALRIGYTGEEWRNGGNAASQKLNFSYQTGTIVNSLTSGTWTPFTSLDFTSPIATSTAGALNGNLAPYRTVIAPTRINLSTPLAVGQEIMLRWEDIDDSGLDHGLAIDDLSVQAVTSGYIRPLLNFSGIPLYYYENAAPGVIGYGASIQDDSTDFDAGTLTASITNGSQAGDRLSIRNQGNGVGQIGLDGRIINYEGKRIGTFKGGIDTENLVITFETANATSTAVQELLNNIVYSNVAENLLGTSRQIEIVLKDGDGLSSNTVTRNPYVIAQSDAPLIGGTTVLYDGSLGGTPDSQNKGLKFFGPGVTPILNSGVTKLDTFTGSNDAFQAGFSNYIGSTNNTSFILDRTTGYTVSFNARVTDEARIASANKNNDGKDDRAGFSVIAISSDGKYGIELGFWKDRIWAQDDGTTQLNKALEPDAAPASNFRTLFTQAEGVNFTTTTLVNYDLTVKGDTYTLFAGGNAILSGKLRDYSAFSGSIDVYENPNFIFFGDNTPSARANIDLNRVAVTTNSISNLTIDEDTITGPIPFKVRDFETAADSLSVYFSSSNTTLVPNRNISYSQTGSDRTFTIAPAANQSGTATITMSVSDGTTGSPTIQRTFDITVNPINDAPTLTNKNILVDEGNIVTITNAMLQVSDVDNIPAELIYTINNLPARGELRLNNNAIVVGGTFTQDDINNNRLTYTHNGSETITDSLNFTVKDRVGVKVGRVSVASDGTQGNNISISPSISADGRYITFNSNAKNLVTGDDNGTSDIFVYDRQSNQTTRVSVASDGTEGNGYSYEHSISADGRYITFRSDASNLVTGDANGTSDIFVYDRQSSQTTRVSVASNGTEGNNFSSSPRISADGRYITFTSDASNLVTGDANGTSDIFVYDRQNNQTTRVSVASNGTQANNYSDEPSISADGRYITFTSKASNLVTGNTNNARNIFVYDRQRNQTTGVSVTSNGTEANNDSYLPSISADGRYITFTSNASNLVAGDTNNASDIFVYDTQLKSINGSAVITVNAVNDAPTLTAPISITVTEDVATALTGISFADVDAGSNSVTAILSVASGIITATSGSGVTVAGTATSLTLSGTLANINSFIAASNLTYTTALNSNATQTLNISIDDGGNTGLGGAKTASGTVTLNVNAINDAPTFSIGGNQSVQMSSGQKTVTGWAYNFNPGGNETSQIAENYIVNVIDNATIFDVAPTIDATGKLTYTPTTLLPGTGTRSATATIEVKAKDNGGTANSGVDTSAAQAFKITVYSNTVNAITATLNADTLTGTDGNDRIDGLDGDDTIYGGLGNDRIIGGGGNDILYGDLENIPAYGVNFTMNDTIYGGIGNDIIYGNGGNDILYGEDESDTIFGGDGDDQIWGGVGDDILNGGSGKDTFVLVRGQGKETIEDFKVNEDKFGCAGGLKYGSTLGFTDVDGGALIKDKGLDVAFVKGITTTDLKNSNNFRLM